MTDLNFHYHASYPTTRLRRLRKTQFVRDLVREIKIDRNDIIWPVIVIDGKNQKQKIDKMPDVFRYSIDKLIIQLEEAVNLGLKAIALFPSIEASLKDEKASNAFDKNNLMVKAITQIKTIYPDLVIICDVALDPYTSHGHDGIIIKDDVHNDETCKLLCEQALVLAQAGCDIIAPSDMMDGRIGIIRNHLDKNNFTDIPILSYAAKYASCFYGAFRNAIRSDFNLGSSNKKTYQMDYANLNEAYREIALDIDEGADLVMVKPGLHYLDIIKLASDNFPVPVFAFHVSSEYTMLKLAAQHGIFDYDAGLLETMIAFKRAGASCILTYAAIEVLRII